MGCPAYWSVQAIWPVNRHLVDFDRAFIILATSLYLREWPRIGTWLNMLLVGTFIDLFNWLLPETDVFVGEFVYFLQVLSY